MSKAGKDISVRVGANVRDIRSGKGYSQRAFAKMVNLDHAYISTLESGKENPTIDTLAKIAEGLEVDICSLFSARPEVDYVGLRND